MVVIKAADHIHVHTGLKCFARGGCSVVGDAVVHELGNGSPVAIDDAAKSPFLSQDFLQGERICGSGNSIQGIESAHDGAGTGVDCGAKWRKINLAQGVLGNLGCVVVATAFGCAITNIMLRTGKNTFGVVQMPALVTAHVGLSKSSAEKWIFAIPFGGAAPTRIAGDVDHWRESPTNSGCRSFSSSDSRGAFGKLGIPRCGNAKRNRKFSAEAMDYVETKYKGDVKARLFDCDALEGIGLVGGDDIEERSDLTFCQHVVVIGATGAGAGGLAGGILNELTDLFFEGHLLQKFFNTRPNGRIIPFGSGLSCGVGGGCGLGRGRMRRKKTGKSHEHARKMQKTIAGIGRHYLDSGSARI